MSRDRDLRVTRLITEALADTGYELVDVEFGGMNRRTIIRVFVDRAEGIGLDDCARVTRLLGDHLDAAEDLGLPAYVLEVSSPGIDRPLRGAADFVRFQGEEAQVSTRAPVAGRSNHRGTIEAVEDGQLLLRQPDLGTTRIPLDDITKARLQRDPWQKARRSR